jgi:division protein CdvB (Snf7/Vps24/ESCRT-III family)
VGAFSFIRRVEDRLHPEPLKERIAHASFRLQSQLEKLEHMYSRLQQRDRELFQRCVGAQVSKDLAHAKIYANESAEIRKIAKVVLGSQLALEKVILRLETVEEFGNIMVQMAPVMSIVKETTSKIAGIVPQVATELEEVNDTLADLTNEATTEVTTTDLPIEATDNEAKKVLEETGLIAEQRLRDHFPDLPSLEMPTTGAVPIAEVATTSGKFNGGLQEQVYQYARQHEGQMSIHTCAKDLGTSPEAIQTALERLRETGKIVIE